VITFSGATISVNGHYFQMEYPVEEAFEADNKVIALLDPDAFVEKFGQFNNLCAVDLSGRRLWTAELPTTDSGDRYYKIASRTPLIAYSIWSYECEIDADTGRIRRRTFFK
jgi:hypothetical protein